MGTTKEYGGIQSPFGDAICPVPGGSGDGVVGSGGISLPDGQKQGSGGKTGMDVTTVSLPNDDSPGTKDPKGIMGGGE